MTQLISLPSGSGFMTDGLLQKYGYELKAEVQNQELLGDCNNFLQSIIQYISCGHALSAGETVAYGYWLTKVIKDENQYMSFWEYNPQATEFIYGIERTLTYWRSQHEICSQAGAAFAPPRADQMIVISDGVYDGDDVEGVRYPSPEHMSGWWFTADRYNDDISTLQTVHAHHISAARPDLAKFFALPYGFRFFSGQDAVWFDKEVAEALD
ncbi:hypothetical protein AB4Y85_19325 [Microvirga sp. 2YAF29]|uniref:immunity protein Imm33 domain-containing protein n=1 Tax=Microvirga sp. 2YAF29 TaxID=3233031 RepID=UPI003F9C7260